MEVHCVSYKEAYLSTNTRLTRGEVGRVMGKGEQAQDKPSCTRYGAKSRVHA